MAAAQGGITMQIAKPSVVFSPAEPEDVSEGLVWIDPSTHTASYYTSGNWIPLVFQGIQIGADHILIGYPNSGDGIKFNSDGNGVDLLHNTEVVARQYNGKFYIYYGELRYSRFFSPSGATEYEVARLENGKFVLLRASIADADFTGPVRFHNTVAFDEAPTYADDDIKAQARTNLGIAEDDDYANPVRFRETVTLDKAPTIGDKPNTRSAMGVPTMASGSVAMSLSADALTTQAVTFPKGLFSAAPNVIATLNYGMTYSSTSQCLVAVDNITATGCNIKVMRRGGTLNVTVQWMASQMYS